MAHMANIVARFTIIYRRSHSFEWNGPEYAQNMSQRVSSTKRDERYYENWILSRSAVNDN